MMELQMMNIWTFFKKEYQVEDMNPPQQKGDQVDNIKIPMKGGVMMRLTSMMDDSDDEGPTLVMDDSMVWQEITLCS